MTLLLLLFSIYVYLYYNNIANSSSSSTQQGGDSELLSALGYDNRLALFIRTELLNNFFERDMLWQH